MTLELKADDILRIAGFLGCDQAEFAARLGISKAYMSRIVNGKDPLTAPIVEKTMRQIEQFIKDNPDDKITQAISDLSYKNMPKEKTLSMTWLRKQWANYTEEDLKVLSQRRRSYVHEMNRAKPVAASENN